MVKIRLTASAISLVAMTLFASCATTSKRGGTVTNLRVVGSSEIERVFGDSPPPFAYPNDGRYLVVTVHTDFDLFDFLDKHRQFPTRVITAYSDDFSEDSHYIAFNPIIEVSSKTGNNSEISGYHGYEIYLVVKRTKEVSKYGDHSQNAEKYLAHDLD